MSEELETPQPILKRTQENHPCRLTPEESIERGKQLGAALGAIAEEEARQAREKLRMKSAIAVLEAKRNELCAIVVTGEEPRETEVCEFADFSTGKARRVRMDTGAQLSERLLTASEKQIHIPLAVPELPLDEPEKPSKRKSATVH